MIVKKTSSKTDIIISVRSREDNDKSTIYKGKEMEVRWTWKLRYTQIMSVVCQFQYKRRVRRLHTENKPHELSTSILC